MLINNPEALKSWLIVILEPLCDADSSALARYVLALLKKDKPEKELKKVMIEQLDVFLSEETKPFVEKLFEAINSESYLTIPTAPIASKVGEELNARAVDVSDIKPDNNQESINTEGAITDTPSTSVYVERNQTPPIEESKTKDIQNNHKSNEATENAMHHSIKAENSAHTQSYAGSHIRSASPPVRANADKENQPRENRRRRASLRSRSRSRSNERVSRRSRSRDRRVNDREKHQRQFRNKSPPSSDSRYVGSHDRRRGDRRRIGGGNVGGNDERSPRFGNNGGEGSRKGRINRSNSRSRSTSLERVRVKTSPIRPGRASPERHMVVAPVDTEIHQRCRDFDEKGYCVRGETCPWDHGVNPVVFEGINNSALISMSLREYNPDAPDLWTRGSGGIAGAPPNPLGGGAAPGLGGGVPPGNINPFSGVSRGGGIMVNPPGNVNFTHMGDKTMNGTPFRNTAPMVPFPFNPAAVTTPLQRELIPIPVLDGNGAAGGEANMHGKRRFELEDSVAIAEGPTKRKVPLNSRLGPRLPNMQNNCSLELRKVPRGLNSIAHLNNHFAKFGKIVNIQISYDGDPEAAIITFSTHAEANVAYRSTEAVLNNRFIKVFWHNQDSNLANSGGVTDTAQSVPSGRKSSQYHLNNVPVVPTPTADSAKISNTATATSQATTSFTSSSAPSLTATSNTDTTSTTTTVTATHVPPSSLRVKNNAVRPVLPIVSNAIIRKKQEEQVKAVAQLANGLRKRKQELMQSYVKQMKSALELVERCDPNDPQRVKTLETVKVLQETIDKLSKEIAAEQEQVQAQIQSHQPPLNKKTKEQQKKELLDIELELFAQQQEGNDTTAIQKRLDELHRSLGIVSGNVVSGPPGINKMTHFSGNRLNPRPRPIFPEVSTRVDRRPKTIVVTGFTSEETDIVLGHFKHFGEITKHDVDKEIPQLILSYATRINAEQAVLRGKLLKDKRLQISWAPSVSPLPNTVSAQIEANKPAQTDNKSPNAANESNNNNSNNNSETEVNTIDTLPELRLEDEEEEDESEDRSWRR